MYVYETSELYPTPCSTDYKSMGEASSPRDRLDYAIEKGKSKEYQYPTPRANGMCGGTGAFQLIADNESLTEEERRSMQSGNGGKLNPDWVEWLMGWDVGWTDLSNGSPKYMPKEDDPAELTETDPSYVPRLTRNRTNRKQRLETIGNGQVPEVAFAAKSFLLEIIRAIWTRGEQFDIIMKT